MAYKYNEVRLEKGLYSEAGKSFEQALETLDPNENYRGTPWPGRSCAPSRPPRRTGKARGKNRFWRRRRRPGPCCPGFSRGMRPPPQSQNQAVRTRRPARPRPPREARRRARRRRGPCGAMSAPWGRGVWR